MQQISVACTDLVPNVRTVYTIEPGVSFSTYAFERIWPMLAGGAVKARKRHALVDINLALITTEAIAARTSVEPNTGSADTTVYARIACTLFCVNFTPSARVPKRAHTVKFPSWNRDIHVGLKTRTAVHARARNALVSIFAHVNLAAISGKGW